MARSNSIINVSIIGDAAKLIGAVGKADAATGGLIKSAAKVYASTRVVQKGFDLVGDALAEADRRGDAIQRLSNQIGKIRTDKLVQTADNFSKIGASAQDILELEATFADLATSAGLAEPKVAANAESMSAMALALAQVHDADPSAIIDALGKAVGGQTRGLKQYGIDLTEAAVQQRALALSGKDNAKELTAQELAAARLSLIYEELNPLMAQIAAGTADVAQRQDELAAKFETVSGKVGAGLEGPVGDLLTWVNDMIDAIPGAIDGWNMLGFAIDGMLRDVLGPLATVRDRVEDLLGLFTDLAKQTGLVSSSSRIGHRSDRETDDAIARQRIRNGLGN